MGCYLCESPRQTYFGYFCKDCREIKNIINVYGRESVLEIVKTCTIRNKTQIENKINMVKNEQEKPEADPPTTRSQKKKTSIKEV